MRAAIAPRTVVEAFLPVEGTVPLAAVYDTANLAGVDDQPLRLAIRRMVAAGDVVQAGRGRSGALSLTTAGRDRLHRDRMGLALAHAQDAGAAPWDGRWRLVALSVPEQERALRDALRRDLRELGAVAVSTGLYVSPHDLADTLSPVARAHLTTATTADLDVRGTRDPRALAETLWPAAPVRSAYRTLATALAQDARDTSVPVAVRQLRLADALERAMRDDPLLPLELRDDPWPPTAVRRAWGERWEALSSAAPAMPLYAGWWPPTTDG